MRGRPGRLIVVSNRLPFSFSRVPGGRWRVEPASGGLITALLPVLRNRGGTWVGWTGAAGTTKDFGPALGSMSRDAGYTAQQRVTMRCPTLLSSFKKR